MFTLKCEHHLNWIGCNEDVDVSSMWYGIIASCSLKMLALEN